MPLDLLHGANHGERGMGTPLWGGSATRAHPQPQGISVNDRAVTNSDAHRAEPGRAAGTAPIRKEKPMQDPLWGKRREEEEEEEDWEEEDDEDDDFEDEEDEEEDDEDDDDDDEWDVDD